MAVALVDAHKSATAADRKSATGTGGRAMPRCGVVCPGSPVDSGQHQLVLWNPDSTLASRSYNLDLSVL